MFSSAPCEYGAEPNTLTDPVVLALPGTLPVLNKEALDKMILMGLMFDCEIADVCKWDRKNYWYPDLPKNYQISQYDQPICKGGSVEIELPGPNRSVMGEHKRIQLTRIHLEEDPGKLTHTGTVSLIDDNRTGTPLAEIVTEPVLRSADEAVAFLNSIRLMLSQAGISDCDMEKGQLRCDANVSVRKVGETEFGVRTESKNLNSVSAVKACIEYEARRQIELYEQGRASEIVQETRRWIADAGYGISMRGKEDSHDYRYFPDPDLMPVRVDEEWKQQLAARLIEAPYDRQRRYMEEHGLPYSTASAMIIDLAMCEFYEAAIREHNRPQEIANLIVNDLRRELSAASEEGTPLFTLDGVKITPSHIAGLVRLVEDGVISKQIARDLISEVCKTGEAPAELVKRKGLQQQSDEGELEKIAREAIAGDPKAVEQFRSGNEKAINAFKGPIMKATRGKADPRAVDQVLRKLLGE